MPVLKVDPNATSALPSDPESPMTATTMAMRLDRVGRRTTEYRVIHAREGEYDGVPAGRYLVNDAGNPVLPY